MEEVTWWVGLRGRGKDIKVKGRRGHPWGSLRQKGSLRCEVDFRHLL